LSEHEIEPVWGLPEPLPAGEAILWQGAPCWRALALRLFHVRILAIYFAAIVTARVAVLVSAGESAAEVASAGAELAAVSATTIAVLALVAWLTGRTTAYTITTRRVVMRYGIALPLTVNIPFRMIEGAELREHADGTGDLPLPLAPSERLAYLALWPHARPWRIARAVPMLRAVGEARAVAQILGRALAASAGMPAVGMPEAPATPGAKARPRAAAAA
jgi:hypothetical protein